MRFANRSKVPRLGRMANYICDEQRTQELSPASGHFRAALSCSPRNGLAELSVSSLMDFGGSRSCAASMQAPGRSASATRLSAARFAAKAPLCYG